MTAAGVVPVRAPRVNDKRVDAETGEVAPGVVEFEVAVPRLTPALR
jgi:hypothetical protein